MKTYRTTFEFIYILIKGWIASIGGLVALIFGIVHGFSLLDSELKSPGSVSLSATILYISLFYTIITTMNALAQDALMQLEGKDDEREE